MAKLDSFFPEGATRGDGRKFRTHYFTVDHWFEPIFKTATGAWVGLDDEGNMESTYEHKVDEEWMEWTPPKKTKKVTLYTPIYSKNNNEVGISYLQDWSNNKESFREEVNHRHFGKIIGWASMECEVEE